MSEWHDSPVVTLPRRRCPYCGETRAGIGWSEQNGDGSTTRFAICKSCSKKTRFVTDSSVELDVVWP